MRKKIFINIDVKYCILMISSGEKKGVSIIKYIILKNQFTFKKEVISQKNRS